MKVGPDIALVASLLGDPARANMLSALMGGDALTAGELARHAGVTPQTASSHLAKLQTGGLVMARKQGRHSYFTLSGDDVAGVVEGLMNLAARTGQQRVRPGPSEPALRHARVCYDHLAGDLGVSLLDNAVARGWLVRDGDALQLAGAGRDAFTAFGVEVAALEGQRRPLCRRCLDWSVRRDHLAGALGARVLGRLLELGWAVRQPGSRVVAFTPRGHAGFEATFGAARAA